MSASMPTSMLTFILRATNWRVGIIGIGEYAGYVYTRAHVYTHVATHVLRYPSAWHVT